MSETPPPPPSPAPEPPEPTKKVKKRRTWKQRLKITALVLIIGVLLIRIGVNLLLPTVVRKVANAYDLDCTFNRMSLGVLSGNAHVWNLELRPKSGGDSIVRADYIQGSLSTPNLFRGRLVVYRAEVDGVNMLIDREPDGSIPLLKRLLAPPADAPIAIKPEPKTAATTQPVDLQAPLRIDAVRVSHVKTTFRDRSVTPTFETTIRTTVRISDVGSSGAPAQFELQVEADPVLDTLIVSGVMRNSPTRIDADLNLLLRGLHPKPAATYLAPLGVRPIANDITIKAQAKLIANAIPNTTDVSARLTVSDVSATVDNTEWASLKTMSLDARKANASAIELGKLLIENGRVSARRSAEGRVQIAGFELVPVTTVVEKAPAPTPTARPAPPATPEVSRASTPFRASLEELRLADLQATFDDKAVQSAGELTARLDDLTVKNIVFDRAKPDGVVSLDGSAALPGVIQAIKWNGTLTPFAARRQAAVKVRAEGIKPDVLRPYLEAFGLESNFAAGVFTVDVDATNTSGTDHNSTTASISNIRLSDRDATLVELSSAVVTGLSIGSADGAIRVEAIDVTGPTLNLRRDKDGALAAFGLRTKGGKAAVVASPSPTPASKAAPATAPAQPAPSTPVKLPRLQIDRYAWKDIRLNFEDSYGTGAPMVLQGQAGVEAADLVFDSAATQPPAKPGRFNAWLELPGVAERLAINGTLQATSEGATIASEFTGKNMTGSAVAPYLKPLGIELTLQDGRVQGKAGANVTMKDDAIKIDIDLADLAYADGEHELAGVNAVRVTGIALKPGQVAVDLVQITKPRGRVARNAEGALEAAGVRLVSRPPSTQPAVPQAVTTGPPAPLKLPAAPIGLLLKQFRLEEGSLQISDRSVKPPLDTALRGSVTLDGASLRNTDALAKLSVTGGLDGIVNNASVTGTLSLATDAPGANLFITAEKINGDALAGYMPAGVHSTLRDGLFAMTLDVALANHAQGGVAGHLAVRDLLLQERTDNATLAKVGAFTIRAGRLDPAGEVLTVDEVSSAGVELDVSRRPDGAIDALGIRLGDSSKPAPAPQAAPTTAPATQPAVAVVATTQPAADVAALVADARRALPLFTVGKIDLKLDRLRMKGLAGADAAPVELARVRLYNAGPVELAGTNPEQRPPLKLQIDGAVDPVVKQFGVSIEATPFAGEPAMTVDVNASGINGKGLTDIAPELANLISGEGLTEGTFVTRLVASLNYGRRGPRDLDLARGFTAAFSVKPLEFRGQPDGPVLAGLEEIRGDGISVQPRKGNVTVKSIEVIRPIGRFVRDEQGLHALGLVIPLKTAESATQPVEVADAPPAKPTPPPAPAAPLERPANEIRLDRFTVTGIDVLFEDRTSAPPTQVPLKTLDLEVRDVSNQMLWTGKPVRFDLLCTSDKVPLPPRRGMTAPTTQFSNGMEMRELFSQITANGRIGLKQTQAGSVTLTGWAKTSVNGFELLGVRGLAEAQKIVIGGGVFDDSNDIRFKDDGSIETRNRVVLTNLSLSEPADGPIRRTLQLPAPIDIAIGAVTDADGSITMNLPVTIESGEVDIGKLVAPAIGAVTNVLVTAIAAAPVKAVGGVGEMLGLGGKSGQAPEQPVELSFLPGVATLEPAQARQLAILAERMRRDDKLELQLRHEMSPADVAHAERLANPPIGDVRVITDRLRRRKSQLMADRAIVAAQARAQFAAQSAAAGESVAALRSIDRQLTQADASLEQLGDLLRPGAAGQADRRTRAASLAVARERFDLIQTAIADTRIPDATNRVRRTNPQFEPVDSLSRGRVVITLVPKKK